MCFTRGLATLLLAAGVASAADFPNMVWLVTEDNSANWLRLYDPNGAPMPAIERLAAQGLVFTHAFSCAPVCSVARSTLISGCYAPRVGAQYHRREAPVPMPDGLHMFPYYLRQAGYYTSNCSKEDYNFLPADKAGVWDDSSRRATYRNRAPGQPFFHVQNYATTHESRLHFTPADLAQPTQTPPDDVQVFPYHPDTELFRYTYARYLDRHRQVDQEMGEFLRQLDADGLLDDTIVFYYGDHGGVLPRGKGYVYESGLQVPLVVYVPEKWRHLSPAPAGSRIDGFVQFVDLSATVLHLAGIPIPHGTDGRPFLGDGVQLAELNARDTAFGYADRFDEKYDLVRTLRKGRFKYMRSYQPFTIDGLQNNYRYKMLAYQEWRTLYRAGKLNPAQRQFFETRAPESLFDLDADPHETHNLASDPAYAATLAELREGLQQWVKSMPDLSFIPEPAFLKAGAANPVRFGQTHREQIGRLVDIADLSLQPFAEARDGLAQALEAGDPWQRYWGLIDCSSFAQAAAEFYPTARAMAANDPEPLVRVRAAEFLALTGQADPGPVLVDVLRQTTDPVEANLILNTAVLLRDGPPGYAFELPPDLRSLPWANQPKREVARRLEYLAPAGSPGGGQP